jgi:hypothetical protein
MRKNYNKKEPRIDRPSKSVKISNNREIKSNNNNVIPNKNINKNRVNTRRNRVINKYNNYPPRFSGNKGNAFVKTVMTNLKNINKNKKANNKTNRTRNRSNIIDCILNPYKMCLTNRYFAIFPTQMKVVKLGFYYNYTVNFKNGDRLLWYPYGVGFQQVYNENNALKDGTANCFSNLFGIDMNDLNSVQAYCTTPCSIHGKYRLIGATLKLTNTTALTSKGGNVFVARMDDDRGAPVYMHRANAATTEKIINPNSEGTSPVIPQIFEALNDLYNNATIKNNAPGTATIYINEVNNKLGNDIFSSYNEYNSANYTFAQNQYQSNIHGGNGIGNNVKFYIRYSNNSPQTYLIEMWQVVEVAPGPTASYGGLGQDSIKGASKKIMEIINNSHPIKIIY